MVFCKNFQSNTYQKDHEVNGRLNKHICAFCFRKTVKSLRKELFDKAELKKRAAGCQLLGWGSCNKIVTKLVLNNKFSNQTKVDRGSVNNVQGRQVGPTEVIKSDVYRDRFVYNSGVKPKHIKALLAKKNVKKCHSNPHVPTVHGQVIRDSVKTAQSDGKIPNCKESNENVNKNSETVSTHVQDSNPGPVNSITAEVMSSPRGKIPLPSGYINQCRPRSEASINNNALTLRSYFAMRDQYVQTRQRLVTKNTPM